MDDRHAVDKAALLQEALARAGFADAQIAPLVEVPLGSRRRVDLVHRGISVRESRGGNGNRESHARSKTGRKK